MTVPKAMQVKICGATDPIELHLLDRVGVDYAGLWFRIPGGKHSLEQRRFLALARTPLRKLRCIGVTTEGDPDVIVEFVRESGISGIQLHGFQLPGVVRQLRSRLGDRMEVFKVLHVRRETCLEGSLLKAYAASGADGFILDSFVSRQQPGSTGRRIPTAPVAALIDCLGPERLFLAGGFDEAGIRRLRATFSIRGVDIDTGARVGSGIDRQRVLAIVGAAHAKDD